VLEKSIASGQDVLIVMVKEILPITRITSWSKVIILYNGKDGRLNTYRKLELYSKPINKEPKFVFIA